MAIEPLCMKGHCSSIEESLFPIAESVLLRVYMPLIFSIFLLAWSEISMSLIVHFGNVLALFHSSSDWVKHIFCWFWANSWNTKRISSWILNLTWPVIVSLVAFPKWFLHHWSIFTFLYFIKLVGKTCHILGFNYSVYVVRSISLLSISEVFRYSRLVIEETWVDLFDSRLVLMGFSVFL